MKRTRKCPNPLFEKWLIEWRDEAKAKGSKLEFHFAKAISSLRKYPLPLESGKDCILLQNFGTKLCAMLDRKIESHSEKIRNSHNSDTKVVNNCDEVEDDIVPKKPRNLDERSSGKASYSKKHETNKKNKVIQESQVPLVCFVPEKMNNKKTSPKRTRDHEISSSDSDSNNEVQLTNEKLPRITNPKTNNDDKEKPKVTKKLQSKNPKSNFNPDEEESGKNSQAVEDLIEQFHITPRTFDVLLLVDNHETSK